MTPKTKNTGQLLIIGGKEDKTEDMVILKKLSEYAKSNGGHLVIMPAATQLPEETIEEYRKVFRKLGVEHIDVVDIRTRAEAFDEANVKKFEKACAVFFTGGDQLRLTSQISDTPIFQAIQKIYDRGCMIAGTSAGAAAMSEVMLVAGKGDESNQAADINMAPGLNFLRSIVIDSHFAHRGRINRLVSAVAQNPKHLGIGIDEDTAILVNHDNTSFEVMGSGAVYVIDGTEIAYSSLSERTSQGIISVFNAKLHVLGEGDCFDLKKRLPIAAKIEEIMDAGEPVE